MLGFVISKLTNRFLIQSCQHENADQQKQTSLLETEKETTMKRILAASAIALVAVTGAASAMSLDTNANMILIQKFAPDADLSQLSDATIAHVLAAIHDDGDMSLVETQSQVRSIIKNAK